MKTFQLIALLCLIIYTYQQTYCSKSTTNKEDCKAENLHSTEKDAGKEYCCYYKNGNNTGCSALSKYQYKHIKDYIEVQLLRGYKDDYSIDCKSLYLQISLLSILLLLM